MTAFLEVKNLTKAYPAPEGRSSSMVFSDINLEAKAGSSLAIVGPSGSGKSTLLNLIGGLDVPTSGDVLVDGQSVHDLSAEAAARFRNLTLGFVFQSHHLLPSLTALENVMVPALAGHGGPTGEALRVRAEELLSKVGLSGRANHLPGQMSGGEKQRVAVARALLHKPRLILADEPTGALDQVNAEGLIDLLIALNREHQTTLVVVTHAIPLARKIGEAWSFSGGNLNRVDL
jgi:lipoprotein-releasing system ATP-binding protein